MSLELFAPYCISYLESMENTNYISANNKRYNGYSNIRSI